MEQLAQRVGVSKGTLYNYFRDKQAVLFSLLDQMGEQLAAEMENILEQESDNAAALRQITRMMLKKMSEYRFLKSAMTEIYINARNEEQRALYRQHKPAWKTSLVVQKLLQRGMDQGDFAVGDVGLLEFLYSSTLVGTDMSSEFDNSFDTANPEVSEKLINFILYGIVPR